MTEQPTALRLAAVPIFDRSITWQSQATIELRRLHQLELVSKVWQEKTEWVQETAQPGELGMHRADVMRQRLERAEAQRDALLEALKELTGHTNKRFTGGVWDRARAAIKQAEENT